MNGENNHIYQDNYVVEDNEDDDDDDVGYDNHEESSIIHIMLLTIELFIFTQSILQIKNLKLHFGFQLKVLITVCFFCNWFCKTCEIQAP